MSSAYVPEALRRRVSEQARHRCGYCLTQEAVVGARFEIDHIFPKSRGGPTAEENLWLCCSDCNDYKGNRFTAEDPVTGRIVPLFNPRVDSWDEHFEWRESGIWVLARRP